jgi:hypothetical protein
MAHQALSSAGEGKQRLQKQSRAQGLRDSIFAHSRPGLASHAAHARVCHWPPARGGPCGPYGLHRFWVSGNLGSVCSVHADRGEDRKVLQFELQYLVIFGCILKRHGFAWAGSGCCCYVRAGVQ